MTQLCNAMLLSSGVPFISSWKTDNAGTSTSTQITIPTISTGTYNCTVDWGDGNTSAITTYNDAAWTHTYSGAGTYTVRVKGTFVGIRFNSDGDRRKLLNISQWGKSRLGNEASYFAGCSNLTITATDVLNLTGTTTLYGLFLDCASITTVPSINSWNFSLVENANYMLSNCTSFNQALSLNTSSVTTVGSMLYGCTSFNQTLSIDTSSVQDMSYMLGGCTSFNQPLSFDTSSVTTMGGMLSGCTSFNQTLSFDTSSVQFMTEMFLGCTAFNQALSFDTSSVQSMAIMLYGCTSFNQPLNFNTSSLSSVDSMLLGCTSFNQNIGSWNITSLTEAVSMMDDVTLSTTNYNALLAGWGAQAVQGGVNFSGGNSHYDAVTGGFNGTAGRALLTDVSFWNISDGGTP